MNTLANEQLWTEFIKDFENEVSGLIEQNLLSYTIPKEEHVRSAIYAFLRKRGLSIEVECDSFKEQRKDGFPKMLEEYDLRIISPFDALVEIKRAWALNDWNNKYAENLNDWNDDLKKLDSITSLPEALPSEGTHTDWNKINRKSEKCFVLIIFSDNQDRFDKLRIKIDEFTQSNKYTLVFFPKTTEIKKGIGIFLYVWVRK